MSEKSPVELEKRGQGNIYLALRDAFVPTPSTRSGGLEMQLAGQVPGWIIRLGLVLATLSLWAAIETWVFADSTSAWSRPLVALAAGLWLALFPSGWACFTALSGAGVALLVFDPLGSVTTGVVAALVVLIYRGSALATRTTAATVIEGTVVWQAVRQALTIGAGAGALKSGSEVLVDLNSGVAVSAGEGLRLAALLIAAVLAVWILPRVGRVRPLSTEPRP